MATVVPAAQALLARFHRLLFEPLMDWCVDATRLYVVPHGVLHYLPFSALYDATQDAYIVEQFAVARLPSASVLPALVARKQKHSTSVAPLVLGNSHEGLLPQAIEEARAISETVQGECHIEEGAKLSLLLEGQARRPLIHIAAHGLFRPDAPLFSAIYLADGSLTTLDIFNSRLHTDLLTLSACESGLGMIYPGDEVMGLSRACLHAGAQSLLLSLWRVEDRSTHEFMTGFYRYIVEGNSPAEALCLVQRNRLAVSDTAHPFFWAAFSITGDAYSPIPLSHEGKQL
jgi:CHAT domain-containing protein